MEEQNYYSPQNFSQPIYSAPPPAIVKKKKTRFILNIILFILTFFTTTVAGVYWSNHDPYQLLNFKFGILYSVLILSILTAHEFGHYFAALYHKVDVTLPFYIPFPFIELNPFGTMGAVIRMKSRASSRKALFDIGISGPIAGWIVSVICLIIGFATLPSIDYLYNIHPEYKTTGIPVEGFSFGYNIIFYTFEKIFTSSPKVFMPPMNEIYHYPFLCAGWFGMLITALNMMPVGQLDGGHISYTMFGEKHKYLAYLTFAFLVVFGLGGLIEFIDPKYSFGSLNWLVWALLILFIIKIKHPDIVTDHEELGTTRLTLGWFSFFIFITTFCPVPFHY